MKQRKLAVGDQEIDVTELHTLVIGSGAAGLNAAIQLHNQGIEDLLVITEGLDMGTSINTGSDKQTYYKSALCGKQLDSPVKMAETYFAPGSMHGDIALAEAAGSTRAFLNLVQLGVAFPQDAYGQFIGYKTDHDPAQRATSVGPYTSRDMCRALITEVQRRKIKVEERSHVTELLTCSAGDTQRTCGAVAYSETGWRAYAAENVIFAVGGPGGLYKDSVYPAVHTGAIGMALKAGAMAQNLAESQYGLASTAFRWNVSGSYMQVIPQFISVDKNGQSREFLADYFPDTAAMHSKIFLKGYQWPFDTQKVIGGSSLIDLLVYIETVEKGNRVYLDYRKNPQGYDLQQLDDEAGNYLKQSGALQDTPFKRLQHMNPGAVELYKKHGIDLAIDRLEIAVCAQHNNGGLAADHWWESTNIKHLFPIGEVNGSHGVARPGGSALNAGQVGGFRAAEYIAHVYKDFSVDLDAFDEAARQAISECNGFLIHGSQDSTPWREARNNFQKRMSTFGAQIRSTEGLKQAVAAAKKQLDELNKNGSDAESSNQMIQALRNRQLCYAHWVYLESLLFHVQSGVGSRGSAMVVAEDGQPIHPLLPNWKMLPENPSFREQLQETMVKDGEIVNRWIERRPIPQSDLWFETAWAAFKSGRHFK